MSAINSDTFIPRPRARASSKSAVLEIDLNRACFHVLPQGSITLAPKKLLSFIDLRGILHPPVKAGD